MIRFERVSMAYPGGKKVLHDLSFVVPKGSLTVLTGPSGAGKSTLLKLIAALERPDQGSIEVNGQDITTLPRAAMPFIRRSLGLIFQEKKLLYDRSVYANVLLPLAISGEPPEDAVKRVRAALDKVGLLGREQENPHTLSGGEQQRLAIARAIVNRPAILLADEPTAGLDAAYTKEIVALLASFQRAGVTVLVTTHDEGPFANVETRRLALEKGRLV
jgi:cell division transport system ATP-binding protein